MEFDSHFAVIQGVLKSQEKIHGKLQNINSGNESKVDTINKKLAEAINQVSMNDDNLRRVYLLLFLNTDHDCFDCLYENPNYGHVIGTIPKLSKYLFIEIITFLKLDNFLYESILFLPPVLSIEVIEMYVILLKTKDSFQLFKYVDFILRAIFVKLILLNVNNESNFNIKLKYFEFFQSIVGNFNSSKIDDYKSWEQNKLYYFSACIMKSITSVVKTCCQFYVKPVFKDDANIKIYNIEINKEFQKEVKIRIDENTDILKNSMQLILSKFLTTAQSITILTWISWIELDEYTEENLQVIIGNEIYCCLQFINQEKIKSCVNSHLYSELTAVLSNLSIKPTDETDEIKYADIETILNNIKNPNKNETIWLSALIKNETFIPDVASLDIIQEKVHLISQEDNEILLNKYMKFIEQNDNLDSNLIILFKNIILSALKNIHVDNQVVLLQSFFKVYGMTDALKLPDFDSKLTEVFNKFVDEDAQTMDFYIDVISLTLQSPETVINKAVKQALSSVHHGKLMVDVLKVLKFVCSFEVKEYNNSLLFNIINNVMLDLDELTDNEKDNFAVLVTRLIKKNLIDENKFLTSCLMIKLYDSIKLQKWSHVVLMLDVFKNLIDDSISDEDNELNLPVLIVFLCQLLDITRCSLPNYNSQLNIVYDKVLEVLTAIIESFSVEEEKIAAVNWMKQELQKLNVITQMHVLSYIPSLSDIISKTSIELYWLKLILCGEGVNIDVSFLSDMRKDIFLRTLLKVLPCFTIREWKIMFNNIVPKEEAHHLHELFITVADAVLLLEASVVPHISDLNSNDDITNISDDDKISGATTVSANACLSFIIRNLIIVVQDIIFPHVKEISKENLAEIFIKLCKILHDFPRATQNYGSWALLKVLQDLIIYAELPKVDNEKSNVLEISKFCAGIGLIPHVELRMNLSKALLSSIKAKETCV